MNFTFREAIPTDAEALLVHLKTVGGETDNLTFGGEGFGASPEREARFISRFNKNLDEIMYVVTDGDFIIANGVIERERIPRLSHRTRLTLTVLRDYWCRGIGSRLMEMMIEFCKSTGASVISLECRADNSRAISLYERHGFTVRGNLQRYFRINGKYYDAVIMERIL